MKSKKKSQDGFPLFKYDKVEIKLYFKGCSAIEEKKKYVAELILELKTSFVFNKTNENREVFERLFPNLEPMIDHADYNYVYNHYMKFIEELSDYIMSLEEIGKQKEKTLESNEVLRKTEIQDNEKSEANDSKSSNKTSFEYSSNFQMVVVNRVKFNFKKRQAAIIERMHDLHEQGFDEVTQDDIFSMIPYKQPPNIRDSFKNCPAWRKLIYYAHDRDYKHFKLFYDLR